MQKTTTLAITMLATWGADAFSVAPPHAVRTRANAGMLTSATMRGTPGAEPSPGIAAASRRDAAAAAARILLSGAAWHLGVCASARAETGSSVVRAEELAGLDHDSLLQLAPSVVPAESLQAWQQEKAETAAELKEALAREAKGQKALPREVQTAGAEKAFLPPVTTTQSSAEALAIAKHLKSIGAVMYGGYGCMHCFRQKQVLGREVVSSLLTYVECGKNGANTQRALCKERGVKGFPTWQINGVLYPGEKSLADLAKLSDFELKPK